MSYAELCTTSNFTFLVGASHPEEFVVRAGELNLAAVAITDRNSFAGIVRGHAAARAVGVRYIVGTRFVLTDAPDILAYPRNRTGYGHLCRILTRGKRRTVKGKCDLTLTDILEEGRDCIFILASGREAPDTVQQLKERFGRDVFLGMMPHYDGADDERFAQRAALAETAGIPLVACGDVLMHRASRRRLADILSCIRERTTIQNLGRLALPNAERRLKSEFEMRRLFREYPQAVRNTITIAEQCTFSLDDLRYAYPDEVHAGQDPDARLRQLTQEGLHWRYPEGAPLNVQAMVEKELSLVASLGYASYFLTVHDLVSFARSRNILCQGRGSAANSVVCYALGITEIAPDTIAMVVERFVSASRNEPPDIDVDFEHERREEVIQYIYDKYGRHRAAICATVVHFRRRAALREVGRAMGFSDDIVAALSSQVWGRSGKGMKEERVRDAGLDPADRRLRQALELVEEITGFPRHLSQHVGGFVITRDRLDEFCPVENAAMEDRTVIEWDKDDIDVVGMMKVDVLALGMLSCIRRAFRLLREWKGLDYTLDTIPKEDPAVYDMLCIADSVGVFQVESRAQMNFLPRMRPRTFYDLVIEVAIIRPGPIQGDMVHPFIRRRHGEEPAVYASKDLEPVLSKTLGVPLFQEQAMRIAVIAAGFSEGEADLLRRALGSFRGPGSVETFRNRFVEGCLGKGYDRQFAENCFRQLEGFSGYGFPESHAASFALLVYASSWLKCHHPEVFCCAILNSQPMGFYAPAQLVRDAREHGVKVLPVCVRHSFYDNVLEPAGDGTLAVRLGFRQIRGFREDDGHWLAAARGAGYASIEDIWLRAGLSRDALMRLAGADAFASYGMNRRQALWSARAIDRGKPLPLFREAGEGQPDLPAPLPVMSRGEEVFQDYVATRLTLRDHPIRLLRAQVGTFNDAATIRDIPDGTRVTVCGLVITRQRPGTASGVIFLTLEDDTGVSNIVVWPATFEKFRKEVMTARFLKIHGKLQREGIVTHIIAGRIENLSMLLDTLSDADTGIDQIEPGHDNVDEARRPVPAIDGGPSDRGRKPLKHVPPHTLHRHTAIRATAGARHPREQAKRLFPSRDFR